MRDEWDNRWRGPRDVSLVVGGWAVVVWWYSLGVPAVDTHRRVRDEQILNHTHSCTKRSAVRHTTQLIEFLWGANEGIYYTIHEILFPNTTNKCEHSRRFWLRLGRVQKSLKSFKCMERKEHYTITGKTATPFYMLGTRLFDKSKAYVSTWPSQRYV